jgi:hypothetical protein
MRRWLAPLWVLGLLLALPAGAAPGPVAVDVSTLSGVRLGRLVGESQGATTYFLLTDVAGLASARTQRGSAGDRISLVTRHGAMHLTRDARRVTVGGRPITLSAPVRLRRGTWRVPGDLLVRALPGLLGAGVRVTPGESGGARVVTPDRVKPVVRPAVASPPRPVAVPALATPRLDAADRAPEPAAPPAPLPEPREPARVESEPARALPRPVPRPAPRVELRVRSYPTYTRVVLEADAPLEPRLVETDGGLTVAFPG